MLKNNKKEEFFSNDDSIQVNGLFPSKDKPHKPEFFRVRIHATLEGTYLSRNQSNQVVSMFVKYNQIYSRTSNDLEFCDKLKHKITLNMQNNSDGYMAV